MPAPHANLVSALTREELAVRHIQFFAAKGADIVVVHVDRIGRALQVGGESGVSCKLGA